MRNRWLRLFIGLVIGNAVLGAVVLLAGGIDGTGGKVFATSLLATAAMLVGIACGTGLRTPRVRVAAVAGMVATATWFATAAISLWTETSADWVGKLSGSALIVSALSAGISLVSLAQLAPRHRWVYRLGVTLAIVLAAALLLVIWWQPAATDWYLRVTGVIAVAVAAITLVIPALHRVAAGERRAAEASRTAVAFCPVCGARIASPTTCETCGVAFAITLVAPPRTPPVDTGAGHEPPPSGAADPEDANGGPGRSRTRRRIEVTSSRTSRRTSRT